MTARKRINLTISNRNLPSRRKTRQSNKLANTPLSRQRKPRTRTSSTPYSQISTSVKHRINKSNRRRSSTAKINIRNPARTIPRTQLSLPFISRRCEQTIRSMHQIHTRSLRNTKINRISSKTYSLRHHHNLTSHFNTLRYSHHRSKRNNIRLIISSPASVTRSPVLRFTGSLSGVSPCLCLASHRRQTNRTMTLAHAAQSNAPKPELTPVASILASLPRIHSLIARVPKPHSRTLVTQHARTISTNINNALPIFYRHTSNKIVLSISNGSFVSLNSNVTIAAVNGSRPHIIRHIRRRIRHFARAYFVIAPCSKCIRIYRTLGHLAPNDRTGHSTLFGSNTRTIRGTIGVTHTCAGQRTIIIFSRKCRNHAGLAVTLATGDVPCGRSFNPFTPRICQVPVSCPFHSNPRSNPRITT